MAGKKSKSRNVIKTKETRSTQPNRTLQIFFIVFSIILILSMVLALASK